MPIFENDFFPSNVSPVQEAMQILDGVAYLTPVLRPLFFDDQCGGAVYFECENFQRTGALKFRGA